MSKKKNRKVVQLPQSLETKIRKRARNLKIGKCYISENWELMREGNIIVTRVHTNGNITVGFFLVDLALLGVKDAYYDFNVSDEMLSDILRQNNGEDEDFVEIEYELVHNIIYGAVEYAEEFGFRPCKEYAVAKYILEEENEQIPFFDIEFGVDDMPTVMCSNEAPGTREINQLTKTVGPGNFQVINIDDLEDEHYLIPDIEDELMPGWDDDIDKLGVPDWNDEDWVKYFKRKQEKQSFRIIQYFVDMAFLDVYDEDLDAFYEVMGGAEYDNAPDKTESMEEQDAISDMMNAVSDGEVDLVSEVIAKSLRNFPDSVSINILALLYSSRSQTAEKTLSDLEKLRRKFPKNISFLNMYSLWLIDNGLLENVTELFNDKPNLKEFDPDRVFSVRDVVDFCSAYCNYFMVIGDLWAAEPYYQVLDTLADENPVYRLMIQRLVFEKLDFLRNEIFTDIED